MGAEREVFGACPLDCPDTCSWIVTVRDGEAVALRGDRRHPYTRGALCAKVTGLLDYRRSPDRLLHPRRRVGGKGEGRFARIGWDEALDEIAERFKTIMAEHGPQAIWPYYGSGGMGMIQGVAGCGRRLWNVLGTSQHLMTICTIAGGYGTGYTLGDNRVGMDPETFGASRLILLWGTNTLTTNHHLWKYVETARRNGAHVVAIDPIRSRTAERVDEHLAPVPGTDAALALGLLHVVLSLGREDREFIGAHTTGWETFRARILEYPPERVSAITGLPRERIVALGRRLAETRPTGIRVTMGLQRHAGGGMAVRAITCIPGVTGDWRYPGGGVVYDTRGFFRGNWKALWRDDLRPPGTRSLSMTRLGEALLEVDDPRVMALLVYASNPMASVPDQTKVRRGLAREDLFTVVLDHFQTDTADYADILLPATTQLEHYDVHKSYGHLYVLGNNPAIAPVGESLPNSEVFRRLAARMGFEEPCFRDSDEDICRTALASGFDWNELKKRGWQRLPKPERFAPFAEGGFPTPSGKCELYSAALEKQGVDPLPFYNPPAEVADEALAQRYPLAFLSPPARHFLNSSFANMARFRDFEREPHLDMHPDDAAARGIRDGDRVRVFNDRGGYTLKARLNGKPRRGVVVAPSVWWKKYARDGGNANNVTSQRTTDLGGGATFYDCRVQVERVDASLR